MVPTYIFFPMEFSTPTGVNISNLEGRFAGLWKHMNPSEMDCTTFSNFISKANDINAIKDFYNSCFLKNSTELVSTELRDVLQTNWANFHNWITLNHFEEREAYINSTLERCGKTSCRVIGDPGNADINGIGASPT